MTHAERRAALEAIAAEVRTCTACRLHEGRTNAVPGEGHPDTEVVFVGEGPGFNEDRLGRPFVGRAGDFLVELLKSVQWRRDEVFITNVVKCRPPDNRDPQPDEIAACRPYLERQLAAIDPALVVTLGRYSMGMFMPGVRISEAHGTVKPVDPATGAADATAYALYHPAAALRSTAVAEQSRADVAGVPAALEASRARRAPHAADRATPEARVVVPVAVSPSVTTMADLPLDPPAEPVRAADVATQSVEVAAPPQPDPAEQSGMFQI
ncbi:MAG: uracil-DNA glycosylase family protein [Chloroflexota bacterium]